MASFLDNLFGGGAEKDAANANRGIYQTYFNNGQSILGQGYHDAQGNLTSALNAYQPLSDLASKYGKGTDLYLDALGINGSAGNDRASAAFTNNPGYTSAVNAGLDAINRRRAVAGMADSGNADIDALTFGQNLQNQQYNNWLSSLSGVNQNTISTTGAAATGQAGAYGSLADLDSQNAQNQVGLLGNWASGNTAANNLQAAGEAAGAKNLLGAGLSLATLGLGGGAGGLGSALGGLGSSLGSLGLTYGSPGTRGSNLFGPVAP